MEGGTGAARRGTRLTTLWEKFLNPKIRDWLRVFTDLHQEHKYEVNIMNTNIEQTSKKSLFVLCQ